MGKKRRSRRRGRSRTDPNHSGAPCPQVGRSGPAAPRLAGGGEARKRPVSKLPFIAVGMMALAAVLFVVFSPGGRTRIQKDGRLNVLLITLDTTRADRLGCYGYSKGRTPNIDGLAGKGVRFENVYCPAPLTLPSHCSIMTGLTPVSHGVHNNGSYELATGWETLAEVLKNAGFRTAAFVASFSVDSRFGLGQGFDVYDDNFQTGLPFKPLNSERKADRISAVFSSWLDRNADAQFFAWVHFFDPHLPYQPPPPYSEEFAADPYDGEVAFMDFHVGRVVDKLAEKGLRDKTLIVLAGDHGEAFGEKVETGHGIFIYDGTMRVPLIILADHRIPPRAVVKSRVRLIDIMPSILDILEIPAPAGTTGESLIPAIEGRSREDLDIYLETFYPRENYGWSELVGLVRGDWKFIRAPKPELYNLAADPGENRNLIASAAKRASDLNARLEELVKAGAGLASAGGRTPSAEVQERLRSLGYTSFSDGGARASYPDPKDKTDVLRLTQQAEGFEFQGRYAEAAAVYERLLDLIPDAPASYVNLALSRARQGKFDEAVQTLKSGIKKIPGSEILLARLGHTYLVTNRLGEALDTMAEVLRINPKNVDALTVTAGVLDTLRRKDEARSFYERAIAIEPENKYLRMSYANNLASSGRLDRAIETYEELTLDYPEDQVLFQYLGIAYGFSGDYAKSIESLKQAVYLKPTPTAYYNLATAYRKTGDFGEAVRYLKLYLDDPRGEPEKSIRAARAELQRLEANPSK